MPPFSNSPIAPTHKFSCAVTRSVGAVPNIVGKKNVRRNPRLRSVLAGFRERVNDGSRLSASMIGFTTRALGAVLFAAGAMTLSLPVASHARELADETASFNLTEENDSIGSSSDKHYSQGLRLSFASGATQSGARASITDRLLLLDKSAESTSAYRYSVSVGQSIFTPANILTATPDPHDRPYAGWLYVGTALYRETPKVLDRAEATLGLIGPGAGGGVVQNNWHYVSRDFLGGGRNAHGWNAQLSNEPGLVLSQERKWRVPANLGTLEADVLPEVNGSIGNIFTYGAIGFLARAGQHISVDWGPPRVQPAVSGTDFVDRSRLGGQWLAWYIFAGAEGRLVARNIFLDGNSFQTSPSVHKEPFVADFTAGITGVTAFGRATLSYVRRTDEFKSQRGEDQFLSITIALLF